MFKFTRAQIAGDVGKESIELLSGRRGSAYSAAQELQYEVTDGCHINFRAAVVKLVGLKLVGIGMASGMVAAAGLSNDATRSCALSSAICLVAGYFYYLIWQVRRQGWVGGPFGLGMLRSRIVVDQGDGSGATAPQRLFVQEAAVDGFRHTLPIRTAALLALLALLAPPTGACGQIVTSVGVRLRAQAD